jgi:hypothetical protein
MNRDERRTRARGRPPEVASIRGIPVLLPTDPDAGGSWISVNASGTTLALLNRYEDTPHDDGGPFISRGLLLRELAWAPDTGVVETELRRLVLSRYRPFTRASVSRGGVPHLFDWTGRELGCTTVVEPGLVRASSGSEQARAEQVRGELFRRASQRPGGLTPLVLESLHRSHRPEIGPLSICMHREEAHTVSLSLITATLSTILFRYIDGPPGESSHVAELSL